MSKKEIVNVDGIDYYSIEFYFTTQQATPQADRTKQILELTLPKKLTSPKQKYKITKKGLLKLK